MKNKHLLFLLWVLFLVPLSLRAYNFQSGDLCYNITSSKAPYTVEVTYQVSVRSDNYAGLTDVTIPEMVTYNGTTYSVTTIGLGAFCGCTNLNSVAIPKTVTRIDDIAFFNCTGLTSIIIPNSVTSIGTSAFSYCSGLTFITIPESVTSIGESAFCDCTGLTSIILQEGMTSIGERAFSGCSSLSSIVFPSTLANIGYSAFYDCDKLGTIYCWAVEPPRCNGNPVNIEWPISLYVPKQSVEAYKAKYPWNEMSLFKGDNRIYPLGVVQHQLINGFYYDVDTLNITTSLVGVEDKKTIGDVTIPGHIRWQGQTYPVTEIGSSAFFSSSLTSITLPEGLKYIGDYCFGQCEALTSLSIPNTVDSIGERICYHCYYLTTVSLGKGLKKIGDGAFWKCTRLASLHLPDSVTAVPAGLCFLCTQLRTVSMGNITAIGKSAFTACHNLLAIDVKAPIPPVCAEQAFSGDESGDNVPYDAVITVPCYASDAYRTALHWNQFYNYQEQYFYFDVVSEDDEKGRVFVTQKPTCDEPVAQIKAVPMTGYKFKEWSDGNTENPRTLIAEMEMKLIAHFQSTTAIDNTEAENAVEVQKIISDGQVLILRNGKTYTLTGQEVR